MTLARLQSAYNFYSFKAFNPFGESCPGAVLGDRVVSSQRSYYTPDSSNLRLFFFFNHLVTLLGK